MLLHSSEDIYAVLHPGESDFLLITFGFNGMAADDSNFWGKAFCASAKLNAVGFMSRRSDWFPAAAMEPAIADVLKEIGRFDRRLTYGSSMGGFGAIRYAKELGAQATLAYAPQYSIDPAKVGHFDPNFSEMFDPTKNTGMEPDGMRHVAEHAFVLYDPGHVKDRSHVDLIKQAAPHAVLVGMPHTGHAVGSVFAGTSKVLRIIRAAANFDEAAVRQIASAERRVAPVRAAHLALEARHRHPRWAAELLLSHGSTMPEGLLKPTRETLLAKAEQMASAGRDRDTIDLLRRAGRMQFSNATEVLRQAKTIAAKGERVEAIAILQDLQQQAPKFSDGLAVLADFLMLEQQFSEAVPIARRCAELEMDNAIAHRRHAIAEEKGGDPVEAVEAARRAVSYAPDDAWMRDMLAGVLQRQGRVAEALDVAKKAAVLGPNLSPIHSRLSVLAARAGEHNLAADAAQRVVDNGGETLPALRTLALRLNIAGKTGEALTAIGKAILLDPENSDLRRQEAIIKLAGETK